MRRIAWLFIGLCLITSVVAATDVTQSQALSKARNTLNGTGWTVSDQMQDGDRYTFTFTRGDTVAELTVAFNGTILHAETWTEETENDVNTADTPTNQNETTTTEARTNQAATPPLAATSGGNLQQLRERVAELEQMVRELRDTVRQLRIDETDTIIEQNNNTRTPEGQTSQSENAKTPPVTNTTRNDSDIPGDKNQTPPTDNDTDNAIPNTATNRSPKTEENVPGPTGRIVQQDTNMNAAQTQKGAKDTPQTNTPPVSIPSSTSAKNNTTQNGETQQTKTSNIQQENSSNTSFLATIFS